MVQGQEANPFGNTGMAVPPLISDPEIPKDTGVTTFEDKSESVQEKSHEIIDKAKDLGRNALDAGNNAFHTVEDRIRETNSFRTLERDKRARMIAAVGTGTVALAGMAMRKRNHRRQTSNIQQTTRHIMSKAKDIIPSR